MVAAVDLVRFGLGGPAWLGWVNVVAGWLVPYALGAAWARGRFDTRRSGPLLIIGGVAAAGLVVWGGYPASMVGVPGAPVSNLNPPTLAAVAFGLAQCGLALLLREPLRRMTAPADDLGGRGRGEPVRHDDLPLAPDGDARGHRRRAAARPAAGPAHQPGRSRLGLARLGWLPVFAIALAVCQAAFGAARRGRAVHPSIRPSIRPVRPSARPPVEERSAKRPR